MLKWEDASPGERGGGGGDDPASQTNQQAEEWSRSNGHPTSPQRSLSSHDETTEQEINSNQSLLDSNRERSKLCKSSSALCSILGRWSRSKPEIAHTLCNNSSTNALYPPSSLCPSTGALFQSSSALGPASILTSTMRKCHTLVSLSSPESPPRPLPIHPYNRLRPQTTALLCSRCSSLLSMASSSKYSVNEGRYVSIAEPSLTPVPTTSCKLCLIQVPTNQTYTLQQCSCVFCLECTKAYVDFEVNQGAYEISCPDAMCQTQGVITLREIENLVTSDNFEKHLRFRKNREVDSDSGLAWCPGPGCETVCTVLTPGGPATCPTCSLRFCSVCRGGCHFETPCPRLSGGPPPPLLAFDSDLIKYCPMCSVPIEKDEGCAQMMCKRCKHVFCWYCLTSLDDDFLLRHYDKGPCKNKLGHSRASVIWHRTQVIGIFAGFGILLLVASPLLLLAAPCIVCCKCRVCSGGDSRIEEDNISPPQNNDEPSRET